MNDPFVQMRQFIMATENLSHLDGEPETTIMETIQPSNSALLKDLECIIFKLRAFMESSGGEVAYGVELGMQRAADMIEHVIKRHGG
jgi:hypothetical protein